MPQRKQTAPTTYESDLGDRSYLMLKIAAEKYFQKYFRSGA